MRVALGPASSRLAVFLEGMGGATVVLDRDPALLGKRLDAGRAAEPAVARVLHAAERGHGFIADALVVDVDDPGLDARGDLQGRIEVPGDDPAGQSVLGVVGQLDGGLSRIDGVDDYRRPEDLGSEDVHVGRHVGEHDRPDERPVRPLDCSVACEQGGPPWRLRP